MSQIKYGVWFHGNSQESEGLCYLGRIPFIANKPDAKDYLEIMRNSNYQGDKYSLCEIYISDEV